MNDQYVQLPADSTGKKVDTTEITVGTNTVERQRVNLADANLAAGLAGVSLDGALQVQSDAQMDLLKRIHIELRVIATILAHGFNVEVESIRIDCSSGE